LTQYTNVTNRHKKHRMKAEAALMHNIVWQKKSGL